MSARAGQRGHAELRPIQIHRGYTKHAEGSVLVCFGDTRVLCTVSVEDRVPAFLRGQGRGWLSAEYAMLPRATGTRCERESVRGRQSGRTQEIQRLIGRALRATLDLASLGERSLHVDCDVIQADGGTRTAAITGAYVAVVDAVRWLQARSPRPGVAAMPDLIRDAVAAVSVGMVDGLALLDLDYDEDARCDTDMNVVMTASGGLVELQGTAEGLPFTRGQLDALLNLARSGIEHLLTAQRAALALPAGDPAGSGSPVGASDAAARGASS